MSPIQPTLTAEQFTLLARLIALPAELFDDCAQAVLHHPTPATSYDPALQFWIDKLYKLDQELRYHYVMHRPSEFRITVSHHDTHRMPGALRLTVGQVVRLVAHSTERWIPVRVVALARTPKDYHEGIIIKQLVHNSSFQVGNRVLFSDDQVDLESSLALDAKKPRRNGASDSD